MRKPLRSLVNFFDQIIYRILNILCYLVLTLFAAVVVVGVRGVGDAVAAVPCTAWLPVAHFC